MPEKNLYDGGSDFLEGGVVKVRVGAACKRFAIKDNSICDRSARGFDGDGAKPRRFFPLRTIRVVTPTRLT